MWIKPFNIPGLTPWICSYTKDGVPYSITLYGSSASRVLEDNCSLLANLTVDGELIGVEKPPKEGSQ